MKKILNILTIGVLTLTSIANANVGLSTLFQQLSNNKKIQFK